ncbi:hypothetical protein RRF57_006204 [Xylaria bambusicola]|uniref:Uncharacterized protein n=1 Tax=Xylaria bambusicola TaxID=326684 RepID=A0AAN7UND8_9PEZI
MHLAQSKLDLSMPRFIELYQVTQVYCQHRGSNITETLDAICWLGLKTWPTFYRHSYSWMTRDEPEAEIPGDNLDDSKLRLLCVAAYLNDMDLAQRLLLEGVHPFATCELFDSPIHLAAFAGHSAMLNMLQEHIPEIETLEVSGNMLYTPRVVRQSHKWPGRELPGAVLGAGEGGVLEMLHLALNIPKKRDTKSTSHFEDVMLSGGVKRCVDDVLSISLSSAQIHTNSVEVHKYIDSLWATPKQSPSGFLKYQCRRGNVKMVRYLLDEGADMRTFSGCDTNPMAEACWAGHEDIVDLLLERGADPNYCASNGHAIADAPLTAAAASGHLSIVRKLLDHGAVVSLSPLYKAFMIEHTAMVHLLLQNCLSFPMDWKHYILGDVLAKGLESMAKLIPARGMVGWLNIHHKLQHPVSPALLEFAKQLDEEYSYT